MSIIILGILIICISIDISYFLVVYSAFNKFDKSNDTPVPVSLIIAVKDEVENLKIALPSILNQDHPKFEIIIVDDHSEDGLKQWIEIYQDSRLNYYKLPNDLKGKKQALKFGIGKAKQPNLVFTDGDCIPNTDLWLSSVSKQFNSFDVVLGIGKYKRESGILNKLIRFDADQIAMSYISLANLSKPYMGVGRNMAYKKKVFDQNNGFESHMDILSGDDDLFIQSINNAKVGTVISPISYTISKAEVTLGNWIHQKSRHLTTSQRYKRIDLVLLSLYNLNRYCYFIPLLLISLVQKQFWPIIFGSLFIYTLVRILFYY
jgi:hypothetical protein